jgi:predicted LPLAT superfamily acyltransferase
MLLHEKIERGEFVVIAADRTSPTAMHRVTPAHFLGELAMFPQGPFILSALLECPVYLLFAIKNSHHSEGTYDIFVERFADQLTFPRRQRECLLTEVIQQYANRLQHYCWLAPLQWFNFFDFWQSARTSEASVEQRGLSDD